MIKIYTDAAVNQTTNKAAIGFLIIHEHQQVQKKALITAIDNHQAEFIAAIKGFEYLIANYNLTDEIIFYYTDSKLVIDSLLKKYSKHYDEQLQILVELQKHAPTVINTWISDNQNQGAHNLALQALHTK